VTDAYSLIRMSTVGQAKGDSTRRQELLTQSETFCAEHGLTLNETLRVIGKSAYHGDHVASGPLAEFIEKVYSRIVKPGSWLLVEDMDRLDRRKVNIALKQFMSLLEAGLVIHTFIDRQTYTLERVNEDPTALIISIVKMTAANDYSAKLSGRIKSKWAQRREAMRAGNGKPTNACPRWLQVIDGVDEFVVIRERLATIKRIIALRHLRLGRHAIASELNRDLSTHPTFHGGDGWHPGTIAALVKNKALIGIYQPRKADGTPDGPEITGFYPAVISDDDFWRAQWGPDNRQSRGRTAMGMANLLKGMCKCSRCGATLVYLNTGKTQFLVCDRARRGLCDDRYHRSYLPLERELLTMLGLFDYTRLLERADPQMRRIASVRAEINEIEATVDRLLEDFSASTPASVTKRIATLETRKIVLTVELGDLGRAARITEASANRDAYAEFKAMIDALLRIPDGEDRLRLRTKIASELRRIIASATADGDRIVFTFRTGGYPTIEVVVRKSRIDELCLRTAGGSTYHFPGQALLANGADSAGDFAAYLDGAKAVDDPWFIATDAA
jgi:DNA invertase Pin-like site-specific DNA recombinase